MKKSQKITKKMITGSALAIGILLSSCNSNSIIEPDNNGENNANDVTVLQGNISTRTLTATNKYLVKGQVFVREGQTLTIEPGTVILGEKASKGTLVIDRGAKIMAQGTRERPIIMTSNQAPGDRDKGDWGGLVILGYARVNLVEPAIEGITPAVIYGGEDDTDNSGVMEYLRVEFAGIELTANNETNGITLGGVGNGTKFENIQVSYGGDDGIEWFGGSVNGKNMVVFATWDDCFDIDNGFSGKLQFGLAIRYPSHADQSESNGLEWDTDGQNDLSRFKTRAVATNFTVIGPAIDGNSYSGNFKQSIDLRRNISGSIFNSVFVGYPTAFRFNHQSAANNYLGSTPTGVIENNIFYARTTAVAIGSNVSTTTVSDITTYLTDNGNTLRLTDASADYSALGINPNLFFNTRLRTEYQKNPNFAVTTGSITSGARFTNTKFTEAEAADNWRFDRTVAYLGAFGTTDWTQGWTNFDPINQVY
ncbi:hypothetical protein [Sphingobacterium rhinopitheci]|uniref:hypothetical protein n=1 Tax=Sphingobacterium rhinopitheci TaxID=2781960 RepID=UPI001F51A1DD|nr:hypothetical protein [Sphingobacterium rhinopitheci]MCI0920226.1 hypothetical protein [Sphingobacterium rhinopitheci]